MNRYGKFRRSARSGGTRKRPEEQFQSDVLTLALLHGWKAIHHRISVGTAPGWPDAYLVRGPRAIASELKVGENVTKSEQREWLDALSGTGVEVALWRPDKAPAREQWWGPIETTDPTWSADGKHCYQFGQIEERLCRVSAQEDIQVAVKHLSLGVMVGLERQQQGPPERLPESDGLRHLFFTSEYNPRAMAPVCGSDRATMRAGLPEDSDCPVCIERGRRIMGKSVWR